MKSPITTVYDEKAGAFVITVPYKKGQDPKAFEVSASGKTRTVATTGGLKDIGCGPDDRVQLNMTMSWNIPKADRVGS